ncbi:hypothetical protein D770_04565 [Flammeovirgaceae bacterium 311]|nr:hypothetical protein D770_04565 [Flammeovirgaceae bacterium 311]
MEEKSVEEIVKELILKVQIDGRGKAAIRGSDLVPYMTHPVYDEIHRQLYAYMEGVDNKNDEDKGLTNSL